MLFYDFWQAAKKIGKLPIVPNMNLPIPSLSLVSQASTLLREMA